MDIAIDFDDTLADKKSAYLKFRSNFKTDYGCNNFLDNTEEGLFLIEPYDGAINSLKRICKDGLKQNILSSTFLERTFWIDKWLQKQNLRVYFNKIIVTSEKETKEYVCLKNKFEYLIDNEIRHFDFKNKSLKRILFDPNYKFEKLDKIQIARNWREIENKLL